LKGWEDIWFVCLVVALVRPSFQPCVPHIGYACTCPVVQGAVTVLREFLPSTVVFERTEECEWTTPSTQAHKALTHSHPLTRGQTLSQTCTQRCLTTHTTQHNTPHHNTTHTNTPSRVGVFSIGTIAPFVLVRHCS